MENCIGRMDVINTKNGKTIMTKEKAKLIADSFLDDMNPDLWNGEGNKPKSFNEMIWDYPISDTVNLEVTFGYDELDGWKYYCDLVYESDNSSFAEQSGYGINFPHNITNTILELCKNSD